MKELWTSPVFGILLTLVAFELGLWIQRKTKLLILNPLMIAILLIILTLTLTNIPLENYQVGGDMINLFLGPATVVLAVPLYRQAKQLKYYIVPIMIGICVGIVSSITTTLLCCKLFGFDEVISASLIPKSITTPIGIELSSQLGGIPAVTILTILVTGVLGAVVAEVVFKVFHIDHPIAKGIALGTSAHAIGTSKALQLGHIEGAMSSLAIGVSGILTVLLASPLWAMLVSVLW